MRIELGLDLEGAAPAAFIRSVARRRSIDISGLFDGDRFRWDDYSAARQAAAVLIRPEDFATLTAEVLAERLFAELHLTPLADLPAFAERIAAIREAGGNSLVAAIPQDVSPDRAKRLTLAAVETGLQGFALTDDARIADYAWCFDCAREAGLALILTARTPATIRDALAFAPHRLHHAGGALDDLALVERLAEGGTVLHLSPASDIALGFAQGWREHPAGKLLDREVRLTIGNQTPAWTPADTCARLADAFDWDEGVFAKLERNALDAALCDDTTRTRLKETL